MPTTSDEAGERLRRSETLRRLAGDMTLVGGWSIEADDLTVYWSEEIYRILEWSEPTEPSIDEAMGRYPPAERERVEAAVAACLVDGTPFDLEVEIFTHTDRLIPVRVMGEPQRDDDGNIVRVIGAFQDISELVRARTAAEVVARQLEISLEHVTERERVLR